MRTSSCLPALLALAACGPAPRQASTEDAIVTARGRSATTTSRSRPTQRPAGASTTANPDAHALSNPAYQTTAPAAVVLSREIYATAAPQLVWDNDGDLLLDSLEDELASKVVPYLQWSRWENARRPIEAVTLFQVRPSGCIGPSCPLVQATSSRPAYRSGIEIRFGFVWARDGGYYGSKSGGCGNDHLGDTLGMTMQLVSMDGVRWHLVQIDSWKMRWPRNSAIFMSGLGGSSTTHIRLYVSAGKHHPFFDTAYNDVDSPYSDWWCNDLVDGGGPLTVPPLVTGGLTHNVGEKKHHGSYFTNNLSVFGWPNDEAWGSSPFLGTDDTSPLHDFWNHSDPAPYAGPLPSQEIGTITGHVEIWGTPRDLVVYYREVNGPSRPWSRVALDGNDFRINLPAGSYGKLYVFRPVASEWNFDDAPKAVFSVPRSSVHVRFEGDKKYSPAPSSGLSAASQHQATVAPTATMKTMWSTALVTDATPRMSATGQRAYSVGTDFYNTLPRMKLYRVKLYALLDDSGQPAATLADAQCSGPVQVPPYDVGPITCGVGAPVAGANVQFVLRAETDHLTPSGATTINRTTNSAGEVTIVIQAGTHPGRMKLRVRVVTNPANPWLLPTRNLTIEVQPDSSHDDDAFVPELRPRIIPQIRRSSPGRWSLAP